MIEIKRSTAEGHKAGGVYGLFIDGERVESGLILRDAPLIGVCSIYGLDYEDALKLAAHPVSEMPEFRHISMEYRLDWSKHITEASISNYEARCSCSLLFGNFIGWDRPYTFAEYFRELSTAVKESGDRDIAIYYNGGEADNPLRRFFVTFNNISRTEPIANELARCGDVLRGFHERVESLLASRRNAGSVTVAFDFPEEVRVPCEQYLLYFVQFLKDLGVEATAELQHKAGEVLFSVTPTNKHEALDKIRAALETYLRLSASPVSSLSTLNYEIAVQRLAGEIQGLQSRLSLARAEIQFKESTIQNQQTLINHQQRLLSGEVMVESVKDVTPKPEAEDKEEVIDGIVSLGQLEYKGVNFNLAEIYRRLKRLFKEE